MKDWNASFDLTLLEDRKGTLQANASFASYAVPGILALPLNLSQNRTATRTEKISFKDKISALADESKNKCGLDALPASPQSPLSGEIGIADIIHRANESRSESGMTIEGLTYTLSFSITRTADLHPKFNIIPAGAVSIGTDADVQGSRMQTHTLSLTFAKNPPDNPCAFPEYKAQYKVCPNLVVALRPSNVAIPPAVETGKATVHTQVHPRIFERTRNNADNI